MTDILKALQDEIEAAEGEIERIKPFAWQNEGLASDYDTLCGYRKGLQAAVDLLTKEQAREVQA